MRLERLSILNYKNIRQAELSFSTGVNALIGHNGEGKTNLLDAIWFLSMCKSATQPLDSSCITHDEGFMVLQGDYRRTDGRPEQVYVGLKAGQKKQVRRGGKAYKRLSEHIGLLPIVMVSPADSSLISGGSEERRRLMDVVISQYNRDYLEALVGYNKALTQRNALLKMENEPDPALMAIWEEEMASKGTTVYECRRDFTERFMPLFDKYYHTIGGGKEAVSMRYVSHGERGPLLETIAASRAKDRIMGYSLHGPHRDDLEMLIGGGKLRHEGSQGQCKSFLIAMKLAQYDLLHQASGGEKPILLLDDIFDKLDAGRVEAIVRLVASDGFGQIFITDTNRSHLDRILDSLTAEHRLFEVKGGVVC